MQETLRFQAYRGSDPPRFVNHAEREVAKLLDYYRIPWDYEPHSFPLEHDADGDRPSGMQQVVRLRVARGDDREEQCEDAVRRWRWPGGFRCPKCGGQEHGVVGKRRLYGRS
mgnify:CR=1 FL=1